MRACQGVYALDVGQRWTGPDGLDIELIVLTSRPCYRVRRRGYVDGHCYTPANLKALLALECSACERCTWNPGSDCGRQDHQRCPRCGHCNGRHE